MSAIRYNGGVGSVASNVAGTWTIPEWCPAHADADAGNGSGACTCSKAVGEDVGQVPPSIAEELVRHGNFVFVVENHEDDSA